MRKRYSEDERQKYMRESGGGGREERETEIKRKEGN
jgi:hypothetical protein